MSQLFTNNAATVLASAKAAGATTMVVQAGTGARFPAPTGGDFFMLTLFKIVDGLEAGYEVVKVTARSIDTFTIIGAQEGTMAAAFGVGDQVSLRVTASWLNKATTDIESKAPVASPAFTGTPTAPTQAAFGNDTQVVNSGWVNQRGLAYKPVNGISLVSGTQPFLESYIGSWLQFSYAGVILSVGIADVKYTGSSFTVRASNAGTVTFPGNGVGLPNNTAPVASYSMVKGQTTTFTSLGATGWFVTADSLMPDEIAVTYAPKANPAFTGTVTGVTKTMVGLSNVDNTADASKPVSTAQQAALDLKAPKANPAFTGTVTGVTKAMVGLSNVDNTSDVGKPVSTAQQAALDLKAPLASPAFTGTVTGVSKAMVGLGNVDNTADTGKPVSTAQQAALDLKAPLANPAFTGTVTGVTKTMVGLGNVDNTADASKPVSTAQQAALGLKAPSANPTFTGTVTGVSKTMVGLGNVDNTADTGKPVSTAQQAALDLKAALNGNVANDFSVASINGSFIGGMKNRVINGDMRIDQRNSGAATTIGFVLDRFSLLYNVNGKLSGGRNLNGQSSPTGFAYNLGVAVTTAYAVTAPDTFGIRHGIEGSNVTDLSWGTAGAKGVTLSFYAFSSVAGTHSGAVANSAATRSYPYTFVLAANTWTLVLVAIPGDTSGTWTTDSGLGVELRWNLGSGSAYSAAAGAWSNSNAVGATGAVSVVSTLGAKFHITGAQFEAGGKTPFSFRSYPEEFNMCRRYCALDVFTNNTVVASGQAYTTGSAYALAPVNSPMRMTPTVSVIGTLARLGGEIVGAPSGTGAGPSGVSFSVVWSATPFVAGDAVMLAAVGNVTIIRESEI